MEAQRASGQVPLVDLAARAPRTDAEVLLVADPPGWFYPVSKQDETGEEGWRKHAFVAAQWVQAMRAPRTVEGDAATMCMLGRGGPESISCLEGWLAEHPTGHLLIAVPAGEAEAGYAAFRRAHDHRVTIVQIPSGLRRDHKAKRAAEAGPR
jgi:hypothetical protein